MVDALEILKCSQGQDRFVFMDTICRQRNSLRFYFYSHTQKRVLKKQQHKVDLQSMSSLLNQHHERPKPTTFLLLQYSAQNNILVIRLITSLEAISKLKQTTLGHNWMLMAMEGLAGDYHIVRARWTHDYCFCEQEPQLGNAPQKPVHLSVPMKQLIGEICMGMGQSAEKVISQSAKQMELLFMKPVDQEKLCYLFITRLVTKSRTHWGYQFSNQFQQRTGPLRTLSRKKPLLCPSCGQTFAEDVVNQIPRHGVYRIQLRHSVARRQPRAVQSAMYDSTKICPGCFSRYSKLVKKQDQFLKSYQNISSFSSDKHEEIPPLPVRRPTQTRGYRRLRGTLSTHKKRSTTTDSTKTNLFDSILDLSLLGRSRN